MIEESAQSPKISIGFVDEIRMCSQKASVLADVDYDNFSFAGREGIRLYLQELSNDLKQIGERLDEAISATLEKNPGK